MKTLESIDVRTLYDTTTNGHKLGDIPATFNPNVKFWTFSVPFAACWRNQMADRHTKRVSFGSFARRLSSPIKTQRTDRIVAHFDEGFNSSRKDTPEHFSLTIATNRKETLIDTKVYSFDQAR